MTVPFKTAPILLPDFSGYSGTAWSCVACDQYTSQPEYWARVRDFVGEAPSTLKMILCLGAAGAAALLIL